MNNYSIAKRLGGGKLSLILYLIMMFSLNSSYSTFAQTCADNNNSWLYYNPAGSDGDLNDASLWCSGNGPSDGNIGRAWYVYGDLVWGNDISVSGGQATYIYGSLVVSGSMSVSGIDVYGKLTVGSVVASDLFTNNNSGQGLVIHEGGYVEIFGSLAGAGAIKIEKGATLIVHGNMKTSNSGNTINGNLIVLGDAEFTNTTVGGDNGVINGGGNIVVVGNMSSVGNNSHYYGDVYEFTPDGTDDIDADITPGDEGAFSDKESGTDFYDLVKEVLDGIVVFPEIKVATLPYSENFEDSSYADYWSIGTGTNNNWVVGAATAYNSSYSAYISDDNGTSASFQEDNEDLDLELKVDLRGFASVNLSFNYRCVGSDYYYNYNGSGYTYCAYGSLFVDEDQLDNVYINRNNWDNRTVSIPSTHLEQVVNLKFRWNNSQYAYYGGVSFCIDDVKITGTLTAPTGFAATANPSESDINLNWSANSVNDTVLVVSSQSNISVNPTVGVIYNVGDELTDGVAVIFKGTAEEFNHSPLKYSTTYYYKAWSTRSGLYSNGQVASATTIDKTTSRVALIETWGDSNDDTGVTWYNTATSSNQQDESDYWFVNGTEQSYGNNGHSAYITFDSWDFDYWSWSWTRTNQGAQYNSDNNGAVQEIMYCIIDLTSFSSSDDCNLIFNWLCNGYSAVDGYSNDAYGRVFIQSGTVLNTDAATHTYFGGISGNNAPNRYYGVTDWQSELFDMSAFYGQKVILGFEWNNSGAANNTPDRQPSFCIDNIKITNASSTVSVAKRLSSISSVANTSITAENVMDITFTDRASGAGNPTTVRQFVLSQGVENSNGLSDWSKAIAGAELRDGTTVVATGDVYGNNITFTPQSELSISEGSSKTYQLYVWLNTDLNENGIVEGDAFDFVIKSDDIVTGEGDDFIQNQSVSSTGIPIDVVASSIAFTQQPSETATFGDAIVRAPIVSAVDANGNIDTDVNSGSVSIVNSGSLIMAIGGQNSSTVTSSFSNGSATFTGLTFTGTDGIVITLSATNGSYGGVESNEITIYDGTTYVGDPDFYIQKVEFGNINNTSGNNYNGSTGKSYGSYTGMSTDVVRGTNYNISFEVYNNLRTGNFFNYKYYDGYIKIYIDWNQDGDFEDVDEEYFISERAYRNQYNYKALTSSVVVPEGASMGTHLMRVEFYAVRRDAKPTATVQYAETEDYSVVVVPEEQIWTGATSTDWNTASNWSLGSVPTDGNNVTIPSNPSGGNYPVISQTATAQMYDLTIQKEGALTVEVGNFVQVKGDLSGVNNGLVLKNSDTKPSSLIVNGTATPSVSVSWTYGVAQEWWYIGHSATGFTNQVYTDAISGSNDYKLYYHRGGYTRINASTNYAFDTPLLAYALMFKNENSTVQYSGQLNLGSYSYDIESKQDYLIANPYAAYIDMLSGGFNLSGAESTIYTRTTIGNGMRGFATYNIAMARVLQAGGNPTDNVSANGGSRYIAPGQAVWVVVNTPLPSGSKVTITPSAMAIGDGGALKSASNGTYDKLRATLISDYSRDELVIGFNDSFGAENYTKYDSRKRFATGGFANLYTIKDDIKTVIATWPAITGSEIIPLAYQVESSGMSDFTLSFEGANQFKSGYDPYLIDSKTGIEINLKTTKSYTFTPDGENDESRLYIVFYESADSDDMTTDIEDVTSNNSDVQIYAYEHKAFVEIDGSLLQNGQAVVSVYSIAGSLLDSFTTVNEKSEFNLPENNQMYLIKVEVDGLVYTQKVIR